LTKYLSIVIKCEQRKNWNDATEVKISTSLMEQEQQQQNSDRTVHVDRKTV